VFMLVGYVSWRLTSCVMSQCKFKKDGTYNTFRIVVLIPLITLAVLMLTEMMVALYDGTRYDRAVSEVFTRRSFEFFWETVQQADKTHDFVRLISAIF